MAIPNANAPSAQAKPFSQSAEHHHSHVVHYFQTSGLPIEQRGDVQVVTLMTQAGRVADAQLGHYPRPTLIGYTSVIGRVLSGIPVADSHAWARFNERDEVVAEEVWWPELPKDLISEVDRFKTILRDSLAEYRNRLPQDIDGSLGSLAIHHPMPTGAEWYVKVTFDVIAHKTVRKSFDIHGQPVDLTPPMLPITEQ